MKGVVFDLGNVLVGFDHTKSARRLSQVTGLPAEELHFKLSGLYSNLGFDDGKVSPEEFHSAVLETIGQTSPDFRTFYEIWNEIFTPIREMLELIPRLKGICRLGLLSNTNPPHFNYCLAEYPMLNHIECKVTSFAAGCSKPQPEIYHRLVSMMGLAPEDILFIDDLPENVEAARNSGLVSIVHDDLTSTLDMIACHLGIPLADFFEGLPKDEKNR